MEKMKIYLDTNTILDFFINQARALKKGEKVLMPEKTKFFIDNLDKLEFIASFLTKTEVMRELVAGHGIEKDNVEEFWKDFMNLLRCEYISAFHFDEEVVSIAGRMKLKVRTLVNFFHLFVARSKNAYFITGDKDMIEKVTENKVYDRILSYIELRNLIASFSQDS